MSQPTRAILPGLTALALSLLLGGCGSADADHSIEEVEAAAAAERNEGAMPVAECDPDDAGLSLPEGFCALAVADDIGAARHLVVDDDGDIYVALRGNDGTGGVMALRDTTGDGRADIRQQFGESGGTGITIHDGALYFAPNDAVLRYPLPGGDQLVPTAAPDTIVAGMPDEGGHTAKSIAITDVGDLFVNIGSRSNACQEETRTAGSPGQDPCTELETRAGIWRFSADATGQRADLGNRYATGMRNMVGIAIGPDGELYGVQHGRDQLAEFWPDLYTEEDNANKPAEELFRIGEGDDFGWPYCYYDPQLNRKVLAPEYGGEGTEIGRCDDAEDPIFAFPAHWAPNGFVFYPEAAEDENRGAAFPQRYRGGAFVAFHGSWNRAPLPQEGYNVVFLPFDGSEPADEFQVFAEGFAGGTLDPRAAEHRPSGVAVGPDGSLYVSDDAGGRIYRILHSGEDDASR